MDVMLSDEAGRLPQQLFLKVAQWLKLAAYLYSPYCLEKLSEKSKLASNRGSASPQNGANALSLGPSRPTDLPLILRSNYFPDSLRETVWKVLSGRSGGLHSALWRAKDTLRICPTMNGVASVRICLVPQGKDALGFTAYGRS
jgi:hypothetical protein